MAELIRAAVRRSTHRGCRNERASMTVMRDMTLLESTFRKEWHMRSRRSRPTGFIARCLPSAAERPPAEPGWIHEIKHRDHRVMARRSSAGVRLFTRNGLDWSERYPAITMAVGVLRCRSCLIDGQAVACNEDEVGLPRGRENVVLFAFDLLELDGRDLRREHALKASSGLRPSGRQRSHTKNYVLTD
jgi:bifunctional non-homologous end joining protein LigD